MADITDVLASLLGGGLSGFPSNSGGSPIGLPTLPAAGQSPIGLPGLPGLTGAGSPIGLPTLPGFSGESAIGLPVLNAKALTFLGRGTPDTPAANRPGAQAQGVANAAVARNNPAVANISLTGLGPGQRTEFLQRAMRLGLQLEAETGIPAQVFAAMAANESNFGNAPGNIMGGVKAAPGDPNAITLDTWEMVNGQRVPMRQSFVASATPLEGMRRVAETLQSGRYAPAYQQLRAGAIDADEFLRRVNAAGYATNPAWAQREIIPLMGEAYNLRETAAALNAAVNAQAASAAIQTAGPQPGPIQAVNQNAYASQVGLSSNVAAAICGPAAVDAFVRVMGRNPGPAEAFQLARDQGLWDLQSGAHGPDSMVRLIGLLGGSARTAPPDPGLAAREVQAGHMVIIDTPKHYFQITGYNPDTQQFQFGDAVGGNRWARLDQIGQWNFGTARTMIVAAGQ